MSKPFDIEVLKATIHQLIETREKLKDLFRRRLVLEPKEIELVSHDERLLDRIIKVLNEKLDDPDFGVEQLGREVGIIFPVSKKIRHLQWLF